MFRQTHSNLGSISFFAFSAYQASVDYEQQCGRYACQSMTLVWLPAFILSLGMLLNANKWMYFVISLKIKILWNKESRKAKEADKFSITLAA